MSDEFEGFFYGLMIDAAKARLAELLALPFPTIQESQFINDLQAIPDVWP